MICRIPGCRLEAPIGKHYCSGHREAMKAVWPEFEQAAVEAAERAAYRLKRPLAKSLAEEATTLVEIGWRPLEICRAIDFRMRIAAVETAVLALPGIGSVPDAYLKSVSKWLGCHVGRGIDPDTVYVTGFSAPCR